MPHVRGFDPHTGTARNPEWAPDGGGRYCQSSRSVDEQPRGLGAIRRSRCECCEGAGDQGLDDAGKTAMRALLGTPTRSSGSLPPMTSLSPRAATWVRRCARRTRWRAGQRRGAATLPVYQASLRISGVSNGGRRRNDKLLASAHQYKGAWDNVHEQISAKISANTYVAQINSVGLAVRRLLMCACWRGTSCHTCRGSKTSSDWSKRRSN